MEGTESKSPTKQEDESQTSLEETIEGYVDFQLSVEDILEEILEDENFYEMTAENYNKKKSYLRKHLNVLSRLHTLLFDQHASLIDEVSKNCPSLIKKEHLDSSYSNSKRHGSVSSDSGSESVNKLLSSPVKEGALKVTEGNAPELLLQKNSNVIQMLAPKDTSGFDVYWYPGDFCLDLKSSMSSSVNEPPLPPFINDALKVKEETNLSKGEGSSDFGLESSMSYVNKPPIPPVIDDALKVEEIKDSGSEPEVLLKKISNLEEEVAGLKQKLQSLTDENGELKLEIEENISDVRLYMSESKLENETMKEELMASKDTEISRLKTAHEKKEKIWNGVTGQLKDNLKEKCELVDELNKKMNRKDGQLDILWAERRSQDILIQQLKTKLTSVKFDNIQKLTDEVKLKVVELEREVDKQR